MKTAILVDGGFYQKRAQTCLGDATAEERATQLHSYCLRHLRQKKNQKKKSSSSKQNSEDDYEFSSELYRIFYYDCRPMTKKIYHPFLGQTVDYSKTALYTYMDQFLKELTRKRKFALRLGKLSEQEAVFQLKYDTLKKLCAHTKTVADLTEQDFRLDVKQKGVDMKIGIDIASMAYKKQVDKIVLIAGDSDFVPAAKLARREGIDIVLDPLGAHIKPDLFEHIDGLRTCDDRFRASFRIV